MKDENILLTAALVKIASALSPEELREHSEEKYGLPYHEALEMVYENIQTIAREALGGVSNSIYLIEKIWVDTIENHIGNAVGYSPFGYVSNEDKAVDFCNEGRVFTSEDCWAIQNEMPEYKYKELKNCN